MDWIGLDFIFFWLLMILTVSVVLVDLLVGADLDGGPQREVGQTPLQLGAHHQVVMLVDPFELLPDVQTLVPGVEDHLGLPGKHTSCMDM